MDNPALIVFLMFLFCTGLPSAIAFAIGRHGMPRLVWPRRGRGQTSPEEEL
jgi:hypothetical protein